MASECDPSAATRSGRAESTDFDVVIIGSGLAGLTTAVALKRRRPEMRVAVYEPEEQSCPPAPEIIPNKGRPVLQRLGVWRRFLAEHHARASERPDQGPGANQTFIYDPDPAGWTVERAWFDSILASAAVQLGVVVQSNSMIVSTSHADVVRMQLTLPDAAAVELTCAFVVDASGPAARYARKRGARHQVRDRLTGVTVSFAASGPLSPPRVEPWADGWWYADQRPDGHLLISCLTDPEAVGALGLNTLDRWWAVLEQTHETRHQVQDAWAESTPIVHSASSHRLDPMTGPNWLAVGEAACRLPPFAGQDILRVLLDAENAAAAIVDHFDGGPGLCRYSHRITSEYNRYVRALEGYYAEKQPRWSGRDFWRQRRMASPAEKRPDEQAR